LDRARVAIAPLRAGSGTPIKILEAMSKDVPVVTTPAGRAGLDELPDGSLAVADSAPDFADRVVGLLEDLDAGERQAALARRWLVARHDLPGVVAGFEALLGEVVDRAGACG
ncbi:MAG: glycosyltransferase family 4 protein, partial [Acidobacteriota bacterium]